MYQQSCTINQKKKPRTARSLLQTEKESHNRNGALDMLNTEKLNMWNSKHDFSNTFF